VLVLSFLERGQIAYLADTPVTPQVLVSTWFGDPLFAAATWALRLIGLAAGVFGARARRRWRRLAVCG